MGERACNSERGTGHAAAAIRDAIAALEAERPDLAARLEALAAALEEDRRAT